MHWFDSGILSRIWRRILPDGNPFLPTVSARTIREVMVRLLLECEGTHAESSELFKLRLANMVDLHDLWFARAHLMQALSVSFGELRARKEMDAVTALFRGLIR